MNTAALPARAHLREDVLKTIADIKSTFQRAAGQPMAAIHADLISHENPECSILLGAYAKSSDLAPVSVRKPMDPFVQEALHDMLCKDPEIGARVVAYVEDQAVNIS